MSVLNICLIVLMIIIDKWLNVNFEDGYLKSIFRLEVTKDFMSTFARMRI